MHIKVKMMKYYSLLYTRYALFPARKARKSLPAKKKVASENNNLSLIQYPLTIHQNYYMTMFQIKSAHNRVYLCEIGIP